VPAESTRVARRAALVDIGAAERGDSRGTVGELLAERIRLARPWYRALSVQRPVHGWIDRINQVLADVRVPPRVDAPDTVHYASRLEDLPQLERAVALAAVAFAERTPLVLLDQLDAFADGEDEAAFFRAVDRLAPTTTTVILGTPIPPRAVEHVTTTRPIAVIDLYSLDRKGALL
jgi:RND superfamily putative drug exporter